MAFLFIEFLYFFTCLLFVHGSFHWIVTDHGRIEPKLDSAFPVHRPYDLISVLTQEQRVISVMKMYKQLMAFKRSADKQWSEIELETEFEKRLYATDPNCMYADYPLYRYRFNPSFIDYPTNNRIKIKNSYFMKKPPNCKSFSSLDFSLLTFPHLKTMVEHANLTATFEDVESDSELDIDLEAILKKNHTDWTAYNLASFYWQIQGNGSNAIECARRAIHFAPKDHRYLPIFNLGTLLQAAHNLGEAAIVLHAAIDLDRGQYRSHVALGHVYSYLNDYPRAAGCYENALSLRPDLIFLAKQRAAVLCHQRLINGLWDIDAALKKIVEELEAYTRMQERWVYTHTEIDLERAFGKMKRPLTDDLNTLWKAVERQTLLLSERMTETTPGMVHSQAQGQKPKGNKKMGDQNIVAFKTKQDENCPDCKPFKNLYTPVASKTVVTQVTEIKEVKGDHAVDEEMFKKIKEWEETMKRNAYLNDFSNCFGKGSESTEGCDFNLLSDYLTVHNEKVEATLKAAETNEDLLDESTIENYVQERSFLRSDAYHDISEL